MEQCTLDKWAKAQEIESAYWKKHLDVEIVKQYGYMKMMKFDPTADHKGKSYLDIGGGPRSILCLIQGAERRVVVDPIVHDGIKEFYKKAGIEFVQIQAEKFNPSKFCYTDVLIYNVLQHVMDPEMVLLQAWAALKPNGTLRLCEFLGIPNGVDGTDYFDCHPHIIAEDWLLPILEKLNNAEIIRAEKYSDPAQHLSQEWIAVDVKKTIGVKNKAPAIIKKIARRNLRFHILGIPHVKTTVDFCACAFTMKVWNMCKMLKNLGHEVIHYGTEGSNPVCDEQVDIVPDSLHQEFYAKWNWKERLFPGYNTHGKIFWDYAAQATPAKIKERIRGSGKHDIILSTFGSAQREQIGSVDERLNGHKGPKVVEMGVGYKGVWADFKVFESYNWMHFVYGWMTKQTEGTPFDTVIHNYYDPNMFQFRDKNKKEDYALFVARNTYDKGLMDAVESTKAVGLKLKVAGQRLGPNGGLMVPQAFEYDHVEYIGYLDVEKRSEVMSKARVFMLPTKYLEPFGGAAVEAQMCGTPAITTDWGAFPETVVHGVTGWRCRTMPDFIEALERIDEIDPKVCRKWAIDNFSLDVAKKKYEDYYQRVSGVRIGKQGWYDPGAYNLDPWIKDYPQTPHERVFIEAD
jgi:glycosyltransferase involved in cell wall biosynthesis